jgi:hypothetical protein
VVLAMVKAITITITMTITITLTITARVLHGGAGDGGSHSRA